jgi:UDP-N-acetylmuramoyl-tripeptide--D-alanyl-D-alanine ligase
MYLWQLKEYRRDRLWAHFKTKDGIRQIIKNINIAVLKKINFPKPTLRIILGLIIFSFLYYNYFFLLLKYIFPYFRHLDFGPFLALIIIFLLSILFMPFFVGLTQIIISFLAWPLKQFIFYLARLKRESSVNLLVIGITGSYGKTATKELVYHALKNDFQVLKTPMNCNTKLGIALFMLKRLNYKSKILIVEMGAYKKGEIKDICLLVKPKIGVLTGINKQHLELFNDFNKLKQAKYELIGSLLNDGVGVYNITNPYVRQLAKKRKIKKLFYGRKRFKIKTSIPGNWYQENMQAAVVIAQYLGLPKKKVIKKLGCIKNFALATKINRFKYKATIIDNSYSSNPNGFSQIIDLARNFKAKQKILITPGIIELGHDSEKIHVRLAKESGKVFDTVILTSNNFKKPFNFGLALNRKKTQLMVLENQDQLLNEFNQLNKRGSLIVIEGRVPGKLKSLILKFCQ